MEPSLLRQLWSVVESFPDNRLSNLDDTCLVRSLTDSLQSDPAFDPDNIPIVSQYISTRMPLIRALSQQS